MQLCNNMGKMMILLILSTTLQLVHSQRDLQTTTCGQLPEDVKLTFQGAEVTQNNLGGVGPDSGAEEIVFSNVGTLDDEPIDLVMSIKDGAEYVLGEEDRNGMICTTAFENCVEGGDFGQVNLLANHETTLVFSFRNGNTGESMTLPGFLISGLDIDGDPEEETYVVKGWDTAFYDRGNTEAYFSEDEEDYCDDGETCLFAQSTNQGAVCDNPTDAFNLRPVTCQDRTVNQKVRAFMLAFSDTSEFEIFFRVAKEGAEYGRNFVFAFATSWVDDCTVAPTISPTGVPIATTAVPTVSPTAGPTASPTEAPTDGPTASPVVSPTDSPVVSPTDSPINSPTGSPVVSPTDSPVVGPTDGPVASPTDIPTTSPVEPETDSPVEAPVESEVEEPPTCPPLALVRTESESDSSKGKAGKGKSGKGKSGKSNASSDSSRKGLRALGVGSRDECPEAREASRSEGKSGKGKSGKSGSSSSSSSSGKSGKGKAGMTGSSSDGKSGKRKSSKSDSSSDGKGKSGKARSSSERY